MTSALSVDTDALEHAAADFREAAAPLAALGEAPLAAGLYRGVTGGPPQVPVVLGLLQQRTEEARTVAGRLAALSNQIADRLIDSACRFGEAEDAGSLGGG